MDDYSATTILENFDAQDPKTRERILNYLEGSGWLRSLVTRLPQDQRGRPLPWYSYSAIALLERRMVPNLDVFEFGSGQSTLWWASRARSVTSVEHHAGWYEHVKNKMPENVDYRHVNIVIGGDYCKTAVQTDRKYDVVVIDGRDRENCSENTPRVLTERGVIIWDNSQRTQYAKAQQKLLDLSFRRVDFFGYGPVNSARWETAIFYREGNWLNL